MPEVPDYLVKLRACRQAELDAMIAIEDAFPRGSKWQVEGVVVTVTGANGNDIGAVWVVLDSPPYWQKSVYCSSLKQLNGVEPCPTTSVNPNPS